MPFITSAISSGSQYTLQCTLVSGSVACTVVSIKSTGAMSAEILTDPNGTRNVPNGAARMIFQVNAPTGSSGTFLVSQSGTTLANLTIGGTSPVDLHVAFTVT
jgi:hypothetical protein